MVATRFIILAAVASVSASLTEEKLFASLLKRQDPGTPEYNCHDNCGMLNRDLFVYQYVIDASLGTAITVSKAGGDVCSNSVFQFDYKNCLQCAGPDNTNIWRYYGNTLSKVATGCGLSTTPLSGKQPDVPEAQHPGDSTPASSTPAPAPQPQSSATPAPSSGAPAPTSDVPAGTSAPVETPVETPGGTPVSSPTDVIITPSVSGSGIPTPSTNGTASFSVVSS